MPTDCAAQCAQCGRSKDEVFSAFPTETQDIRNHLNCPVLYYAIQGDILGSPSAVKIMFDFFTSRNLRNIHELSNQKIGHRDYRTVSEIKEDQTNLHHFAHHYIFLNGLLALRLGHFGFFKKRKAQDNVWQHMLCFIDNAVIRRKQYDSKEPLYPEADSMPPLRHSKL